jgi:hypothetical protein
MRAASALDTRTFLSTTEASRILGMISPGLFERLESFDTGEILRHDLHDLHSRQVLLETAANARNRAARSNAGYEMGELSVRLGQDLAGCVVIMSEPVILIGVLIAMEESLGFSLVNTMTFAKRLVVAFDRVGLNECGAVGLNPHFSFFAGVARHNDLHWNFHHRAEHRIRDSGIT